MILEFIILSSAVTLWNKKKPFQPLVGQKQKARKKKSPKKSDRPVNPKQLIRDIRRAIKDEGREQLKMDIDPEQSEELEKVRLKKRREMRLSLGATGLALLGGVNPLFAVAGAIAVLYLLKETLILIRKDFRKGHYLSVYLINLFMTMAMIISGHLILATFAAVMINFFARIVNRVEEDSQQQLISVFSGHPEQVWLLRDGLEIQVDFHSLEAGDTVIVNAGEVIPADGRIQSGEGQVDQHLLTGESQPAEKAVGEEVFASTLLLSGRLAIEVTTAGNATMAAKIGDVLNQTQSYKDTLMSRGRKISDRFLPVTLGLSAVTLPLLGSSAALAVMWSQLGGTMSPSGSLTVLSYLQILSRSNILIKDGRVFESLRSVDTVVFDKTGTLTLEQPTVGEIHTFAAFDEKAVLRYAAAAEQRQPHPVAKAIIARAEEERIVPPEPEEAAYEVGFGIKVIAEGRTIRVGSARFLRREKIDLPDAASSVQQLAEHDGCSLIYVAVDNRLAGILEIRPTVRPEAVSVIQCLKQRGITVCIISGDHEAPTRAMAKQLGIDQYFSEVLPENKADHVNQLKEEGRFVCFVGDGINDAVALKAAHISVSLKGASTAATDTAQVIFMDGTLNSLEPLFDFADDFEETMQRNLAISFVPGTITIAGVFLLHLGVAAAMGIFYLGCFAGLGNVLWPLVRHQEEHAELPELMEPEDCSDKNSTNYGLKVHRMKGD